MASGQMGPQMRFVVGHSQQFHISMPIVGVLPADHTEAIWGAVVAGKVTVEQELLSERGNESTG